MNKSFSSAFGVSRNAYDKVVGHNNRCHKPFDESLPGPAHYSPKQTKTLS